MDKVYNARNNFWIDIPHKKRAKKRVKNWKTTKKRMVFIFEKVKLGVGLYFLGSIYIWDTWGMAEKIVKVCDQNSDFHL